MTIDVIDSKGLQVKLREVVWLPLIFLTCSIICFLLAFFFAYFVFKVFLYINTIIMLIGLTYTILFGLVPLAFRNRPPIYDKNELVSIIIAVFNDGLVLEKTLENLNQLEYPNYEVIVVYSIKSTDNTKDVAQRFENQYTHFRAFEEDNSKANALNIGIDHARGDYILILDSDSLIYNGFIERALSYFSDPSIKCVQSVPLGVNANQNLATRLGWVLLLYFNFIACGQDKYFHGVKFSGRGGIWRKGALMECGKFEAENPNEDHEITTRVNINHHDWRGVYDNQLFCYEYFATNYSSLYLQQIRWNVGGLIYRTKGFRNIKYLSKSQKFIYASTFLLTVLFPMIYWVSYGMNFIQFFVNFINPDISFGGGVFLILMGLCSLIINFIIMFIFAYRSYYKSKIAKCSLKFIIVQVFVVVYFMGVVMAVIALNTIKVVAQSKHQSSFVKVDKCNVELA